MLLAGPAKVRLLKPARFPMSRAGVAAPFFEGAVGAGVGIFGAGHLGC